MKTTGLCLLFSGLIIFLLSCEKDNAGPGGTAIVHGNISHDSRSIPFASVYIKYGTIDFPGTDTSLYDNKIAANLSGFYEFIELQNGKYYIYVEGYDQQISEEVNGGIGLRIEQEGQEMEADILVEERVE